MQCNFVRIRTFISSVIALQFTSEQMDLPVSMNSFTVMSFNVRQAAGDDGEHSWPHREDALIKTIRDRRPTLLATQETHPEQIESILSALPEYASFGSGRYGDACDKHNKIFYLRDHAQLINTGDTWFSETPGSPGARVGAYLVHAWLRGAGYGYAAASS
jgi:hypothetical protein